MPRAETLCFGPYRLAGPHGPLWRDNQVVPLPPKILAVLWTLVRQADQVVSKATLLDTVWAGTTVSDAALTTALRILRRALGEDPRTPHYIATVHRLGYRFVAPVTAMGLPPPMAVAKDAVALPPNVRSAAPLPTLVGREVELSQLHTCFAQVLHGRRQTVFVSGEAGVGKSTLVDAFLYQISSTETLWLGRGQCIEHYGAGEAYLPVLDALGRLGREPEGERLVTYLRQYAPTWLEQLPALLPAAALENAPRPGHSITQTRMLRELVEALEALATERPLVLVLEDLHWSDVSTVEALTLLARRRDVARLLVLGMYRPVELIVQDHPFKTVKQELTAHGQCVDIPLGYLRRDAVAAYLAQHGGATDGDDGIAAWVYRRTMGHPLFMVQVLDYLVQHGHLGAAAPAMPGGAGVTILEQEMPQRLQQLIEAQLGRLDIVAQQVLEVASVAGVEFVVASVAAGLQMAPEAIEAVCERLARQGQFLEERSLVDWPDGTVSGQYGFRHALYQEVLYQRIGAGRRARLHLLLGRREEVGYGTQASARAAELAMHFERGRDYWRALQYLRQAAETAARRSAQHEAISLLTKGIELLTHLPDTPERAQYELALRIPLEQALIAVQGYAAPAGGAVFSRAHALCQHLQKSAPRFAVLHGLQHFATSTERSSAPARQASS